MKKSENKDIIAKRIRMAMAGANIKKGTLAEIMNISRDKLWRILKGEKISVQELQLIAEATRKPLAYFLDETDIDLPANADPGSRYSKLEPVVKVPIITWKQAIQHTAGAPLPIDETTKFVYSTRGGPSMFALKIEDNAMAGKYNIDEVVIIDPVGKELLEALEDGSFYFIKKIDLSEGMIRQIEIIHGKIVMRAMNETTKRIDFDSKKFEIVGKVLGKWVAER